MCELYREERPISTDSPPPLGKVPEQHVQAGVDAPVMDIAMFTDRLRTRSGARPTRAPISSGWRANRCAATASSTASRAGRSTDQPVVRGSTGVVPAPCQGRSRSPSPSSSAPNRPSTPTRRIAAPRSQAARSILNLLGAVALPASTSNPDRAGDALRDRRLVAVGWNRIEQLGVLTQDMADAGGRAQWNAHSLRI